MPGFGIVRLAALGTAVAALGAATSVDPARALATQASIVEHRDIDYVEGLDYPDDQDTLDVFMPAGASDAPVVVFFHGGGLQLGSKSSGEALVSSLAPRGIGVVSANYRLSPAVMHPAHVQDAAAAVAWTLSNIASYGGDPEQIYLSGHSAGAYLAALLSLDPSWLHAHGMATSVIRGTVPISPFLYVEEVAPVREKTVWGDDLDVWRKASVTPYIGPNRPPMRFIYADGDDAWRREQIERLTRELEAAGDVPVDAVKISDRDHFTVLRRMADADDPAARRLAEFVLGLAGR